MNTGRFFLFALLILCGSCARKEVQLPQIEAHGISGVQNHSSIWIFFETEGADTLAVLNKNNKLMNTHWIFHIDRNLPMHAIIPHLEAMQISRNKSSIHKKEGMRNYFSFSSTLDKTVSLVPFPETHFIDDRQAWEAFAGSSKDTCTILAEIGKDGMLIDNRSYAFAQIDSSFKYGAPCDSIGETWLLLQYDADLKYGTYLRAKARLADAGLLTHPKEYIYSVK